MLDDLELQQVQQLGVWQREDVREQEVPAIEGGYFEDFGRRATRIRVQGVLTGPKAQNQLNALRTKVRNAKAVPFVADITTATKVRQVLVEEMHVRELAGKPQRFQYDFRLVEFAAARKPKEALPATTPPPVSVPSSAPSSFKS